MSRFIRQNIFHSAERIRIPEVEQDCFALVSAEGIDGSEECFKKDAWVRHANRQYGEAAAMSEWITNSVRDFHPEGEIVSANGKADFCTDFLVASDKFPGSRVGLEHWKMDDNGNNSRLPNQ